ncbi:hypothetical protein AOQ88_00950 [Candidatus Riesia sp. GBBU]|nr:hypothetical protein AOQ88_00950 [Candidatus Riesia sp. GBBU]
MKFVDKALIKVIAGRGGNGCKSFFSRKFNLHSRRSGGDGGDGGSIYIISDRNLNTLVDYKFKSIIKAESGRNGMNFLKKGRNGKDSFIYVPIGTYVYEEEDNKLIGKMTRHKQVLLVAKGGRHGLGNVRCKSRNYNYDINKRIFGKFGEKKKILLELKLLADVGTVGLPNSGKSTFVRSVSSSRTKIASYPFTTMFPELGVVNINRLNKFVISDIPGIIHGAWKGIGLGTRFLKHLEHCSLLLHIVDVSVDFSIVLKNIQIIENEIKNYDQDLYKKNRWLVFNKIDLINSSKIISLKDLIKTEIKPVKYYLVSSKKKIGTFLLCKEIFEFIKNKR